MGSSQSVQLSTDSTQPFDSKNERLKKIVSPENKVLPLPVQGQMLLKSTQNGTILQNGGTLSRHHALHQHRKSHSDPNMVSYQPALNGRNVRAAQEKLCLYSQGTSKAKINVKKKSKAPEPPCPFEDLKVNNSRMRNYEKRNSTSSKEDLSSCPSLQQNRSKSLDRNHNTTLLSENNTLVEAIKEACKKRAEKLQDSAKENEINQINLVKWIDEQCHNTAPLHIKQADKNPNSFAQKCDAPPKRYYFTDIEVLKTPEPAPKKAAEVPRHIKPSKSPMTKAIISHTFVASDQSSFDKKVLEITPQSINSHGPPKNNTSKAGENNIIRPFSRGDDTSFSCSDEEADLELKIKPIIPKKRPNFQNFSSAQIWKSISLESDKSMIGSDDPDLYEEKIRRKFKAIAPRSSRKKENSSLNPCNGNLRSENGKVRELGPTRQRHKPSNSSWIPQQDIDDSDGGENNENLNRDYIMPSQGDKIDLPEVFNFTKSLPRMSELPYLNETKNYFSDIEPKSIPSKAPFEKDSSGPFNSLRNLKKALGIRSKMIKDKPSTDIDSNWSLSRSLPDFTTVNHTKVALPNYRKTSRNELFHSNDHERETPNNAIVAQSSINRNSKYLNQVSGDNYSKKLKYMSTLKVEERRKLEAKISRQIIKEEKQREREIEWMNRVEEEFRKRRDREKSSIQKKLSLLVSKMDANSSYYNAKESPTVLYKNNIFKPADDQEFFLRSYNNIRNKNHHHLRDIAYSSQSDISCSDSSRTTPQLPYSGPCDGENCMELNSSDSYVSTTDCKCHNGIYQTSNEISFRGAPSNQYSCKQNNNKGLRNGSHFLELENFKNKPSHNFPEFSYQRKAPPHDKSSSTEARYSRFQPPQEKKWDPSSTDLSEDDYKDDTPTRSPNFSRRNPLRNRGRRSGPNNLSAGRIGLPADNLYSENF